MLSGYGLWWFEDICDPLDFETLADVAASYPSPIAAGEALFSLPEAPAGAAWRPASGSRRAGVRSAHCYGLTAYVRIVEEFLARGWPARAFWPHGGHLFGLHVAAGLGWAAPS